MYADFVKAQAAFAPALKTSVNPAFRSKYAALDACIEAVIDALHANGFALVQRTHPDERGVTVETLLLHRSGESISGGTLHVPAAKQDPQGFGSALSYARRYSLMATCGIAPENDDDGNAASKAIQARAKPAIQPAAGQIAPAREAAALTPITMQQRQEVEERGADMVQAFEAGNEAQALKLWREVEDADVKVHLWAYLGSESKLRAFLKAQGSAKAAA